MDKIDWLNKCLYWKNKWPQITSEFDCDKNGINLYKFMSILNQNLEEDSTIVSDAGSALYVPSQSLELKQNQRYILDSAQGGMGSALPMGIGVSLARNNRKTIVITGDGSICTNIQELAVVKYHKLNIIIFIWTNGGYLSIKNTQEAFFNKRYFGTDSKTGLYFPSFQKVADSYEIKYLKVHKVMNLDNIIKQALNLNEPCMIEVICNSNQKIQPSLVLKNGKSCPLSDMSPFLSEEEYNKEMINE